MIDVGASCPFMSHYLNMSCVAPFPAVALNQRKHHARGERTVREPALLVVDGANVVGSVPDGWWRDRPAAAAKLRDALVPVAVDGLPSMRSPVEVVLVVEGVAARLPEVPGVRVVRAAGSGDDAIVELVKDEGSGG